MNTIKFGEKPSNISPSTALVHKCLKKIYIPFFVAFLLQSYVRGPSHYGCCVKSTLDKLFSRRQGSSPLKYTNSGDGISLKRIVCLFEENLSFHLYLGQTFFHRTNSWCQNSQKCYHIDILKGVAFGQRPTAFSIKAQQTNFCSPPIKLLESFVLSTVV
jgi:hypothetical protein